MDIFRIVNLFFDVFLFSNFFSGDLYIRSMIFLYFGLISFNFLKIQPPPQEATFARLGKESVLQAFFHPPQPDPVAASELDSGSFSLQDKVNYAVSEREESNRCNDVDEDGRL